MISDILDLTLRELVGWGVGLLAVLFLLYVVIMRLKRRRDRGDLSARHYVLAAAVLPFGIGLDAFWNVVFGTIFFVDPPREWLLTARLQRYKREQPKAWRGRFAAWFCARVLNPHDPEHC